MNKSHRINNKLNDLVSILKKRDNNPNRFLTSIQLSKFNTDQVSGTNKYKRSNDSNLANILKVIYKNKPSDNIQLKNNNKKERTENKLCDINSYKVVNKQNMAKKFSHDKSNNKAVAKQDDNIFKSKYFSIINNNLEQFFDKFINLEISHMEPIYLGFCLAINPKFYIYDEETKINFMTSLKKMMAIDLEKEDLYRKLGYNKKRIFKRSTFETQLFENDYNIGDTFYKYLGDYFDINFLLLEQGVYNCYNNYSSKRMSVVLQRIGTNIYINLNTKGISFVHPDKIKLNNNNESSKTNESNLNNKKLIELQELATDYNIEIKKQGKSKVVNKTKKELIQAIENLINK